MNLQALPSSQQTVGQKKGEISFVQIQVSEPFVFSFKIKNKNQDAKKVWSLLT